MIFRVKEIMEERGLNKYQVWRKTGVRMETLKLLCDNTCKRVDVTALIDLAKFFNLSVKDLIKEGV